MDNNLIVKNFRNREIHTFFWNNRLCWIAGEVVDAMEYADATATVSHCIAAEKFQLGDEYDVLEKDSLREFKKVANQLTKNTLVSPNTKNLTIFYELGLYGFIQYTEKPIGIEFRTWLRRDVLPEIRETGAYISEKASPSLLREKADKLEKLGMINNTAKILLPVLTEAGVRPEIRAPSQCSSFTAKQGLNSILRGSLWTSRITHARLSRRSWDCTALEKMENKSLTPARFLGSWNASKSEMTKNFSPSSRKTDTWGPRNSFPNQW